jgi:serine/threonine protein kinase
VKRLDFNEMDIGGIVGEGSFGTVREGWWRDMHIAVKALRVSDLGIASRGETGEDSTSRCRSRGPAKDWTASQALMLSKAQEKELLHEAETMARVCNHSFVIQFIGIVLDPVPCVVTLFCQNGSVENLILKSPNSAVPDYDTLLRFALETAIGVKHLHMEGIIHRDLATRNLLIDENYHIRVADFGFARVKDAAASKGYTNSTMGPVRWSAPEAMRRRRYSESSDVFSFGVVLYEMFAQSYPWPGYDTLDVAVRVCGGERMEIPPEVPLDVADLMILCWSHEESLRPTLNDVIDTIKFLREDAAMVEQEERDLQWILKGASGGAEGAEGLALGEGEGFATPEEFFMRVETQGTEVEVSYSDMSPSDSYGVAHKVLFQT